MTNRVKIFNFIIVVISTLFTLGFIEILLRFNDQKPFKYEKFEENEPSTNNFNSSLGWYPKPGKYIFKINNQEIEQTILKDGSRITGRSFLTEKNQLLLLGGSFTQGQGVSDKDTFAYKLQNKLKTYEVLNYGVGGYGTYQSYLLLENLISKENNYKLIIYFFIDHHLVRNYGDAKWLAHLSKYSKRNHLYLPYARVKDGELLRFKPIKYLDLPLSNKIVLLHKIQKKYMEYKLKINETMKFDVFIKIVKKMRETSNKNRSNFILVNLNSDKETIKKINKELDLFGIKYFDCNLDLKSTDLIVKNDGHPNELAHNLYMDCIYSNLVKRGLID